MPKIRDLAISTVPLKAGQANVDCHHGQTGVPPPDPCNPTNKPQCKGSPPPKPNKLNAGGIPPHAVRELRQHLQQQINRQLQD